MEHYVIKPAGEAGEAAVHAGLRAYNRTFVSDTADLSLVVEDGAIAQRGTHEELMAAGGLYKKFVAAREQSRGWSQR